MTEPKTIHAGDSVSWSREACGCPAAGGWTLHYALRGPGQIDIDATGVGEVFTVAIGASVTADWAPGDYVFSCFVKRGDDERKTLSSGRIKVLEDLASSTSDGRSHAKRMLDAIQATLEKRATKDQQAYQIDGMQISRIPIPELIQLRDRYRIEYRRELEAAGSAVPRQRVIKVRMR